MTKTVRSIVDDLVQRRLWPVVVLLVVAIVAVPLLLTKSSSHPSTAPAGASGANGVTADIAAVDGATADTPASGRALAHLGKDDPFVQRGKQGSTSPGASSSTSSGSTASFSGGVGPAGSSAGLGSSSLSSSSLGTSSGGGAPATSSSSTPDTGTGTAPVAPAAPAKPKAKDKAKKDTGPAVSLDLAFGRVNSDLVRHRQLTRFSALPMAGNPVVIFLGVDGKDTAVFLVSSQAAPQGDGKCRPDPDDCQTVRMRPGDTEFFAVTPDSGAPVTYRLDLKKVHVRRDEAKASAASARVRAKAGAAVRPPRKASWGKLVKRLKLSDDAGFGDVAAGLDAVGAQVGAAATP